MENGEALTLLLHPLRLRVVHALAGGRELTIAQLCARFPEVSRASMYRHVGMLAEAGILEVSAQQPARGALERRYRLQQARAAVTAQRAQSASREEYRQAFAVAMAVLLAEFSAYLDREGADPAADSVGFRQHALWLSPAELAELIGELRQVIAPRLAGEPSPERAQYLLSPVLFPIGGTV